MIEVCNCGGGHRTRLREDFVYLWGAPSHVHKGGGKRRPALEGRAIGGVQLGFPILVGLPFVFQEGERGKEEEREKERGGRHPLLVQFGPAHEGARGHPLRPFSPFPYGPIRPNTSPGEFP